MNKIISISVWGENERYLTGATRQFELAQKHLPDWEFRVYTDVPQKVNVPSECLFDVPPKTFGAFWRFLPLFESENHMVLSRDSDSRFTAREIRAIREWENSDYVFHVIRDHDSHFQFPIMAGLFGCKGKLSVSLYDLMRLFAKNTNYYTSDQVYLRDHVFPAVQESMMVHSMHEGWFGETRNKLKNRFDFCGNGYDENDMPLYPPTLAECVGFEPKDVSNDYRFVEGAYE